MTEHADHKYSIKIHTEDEPVVYCLRALSKYCQRTGNNNIPWGGTKEKDWIDDEKQVTFRFSKPEYRELFVSELKRLLPDNLWKEKSRNDNDPAVKQIKNKY